MASSIVTRWPPRAVDSLLWSLRALTDVVSDESKDLSVESRSWLGKLLVVRSSGYLEQVVSECVRGHVEGKSGGMVRTFARSWLERTRNPSPSNLLDLVGRFDQSMKDELEGLFDADDGRLKRDLSFLVAMRNHVAHGLNDNVGPIRSLELCGVAQEVADWFVLRFNPIR
jgi:hypothetical protein